jgi:hypothetical protein
MTEQEESRPLTAGERLLREIDANAYWGIGRMGCHDIPAPPTIDRSPKPGEPYYVVSLDTETGSIVTTHFDGEGNEIIKDQANE